MVSFVRSTVAQGRPRERLLLAMPSFLQSLSWRQISAHQIGFINFTIRIAQ
jgi:hypothetical protein